MSKFDLYEVVAYSGHHGEQEPRWLVVGEERIALRLLRSWLEPDARMFEVDGAGRRYRLRLALPEHTWTVTRLDP